MAERDVVVVEGSTTLLVPLVPNFLTVTTMPGECSVPVESLTDEQLRKVGTAWTEVLVAHAQERRNQKSRRQTHPQSKNPRGVVR